MASGLDTRRVPRACSRRLACLLAGVLLSGVGLLIGGGVAWAHAIPVSTDPAQGAVLAALPARVSVTFDEPVVLPPEGVRVFAPGGARVDDGTPVHPGAGGDTVAVGLRPDSAQGSYTVAWRVISADTHPVSGAFVFSVGHPSSTSSTSPTSPPPASMRPGSRAVAVLYALVRVAAYGCDAALTGALALILLCRATGLAYTMARRVAILGWVGLVAATLATGLLQGPYGTGTGLDHLFDPAALSATLDLRLGAALVARLVLLGVAAVLLSALGQRPRTSAPARGATTAVGVLLAVGIAATWSISGHAAFGPQSQIGPFADTAHLVAMGVWLGGLCVLALALGRRRVSGADRGHLTEVLVRFSPLALGCVLVLVATGSYQSWRQLGGWSDFYDTTYGGLLWAKLVTVAALLTAAGASRRVLHRRVRNHLPREAVVAAVASPVMARSGPTPPSLSVPSAPGAATGLGTLRRTLAIETALAVIVLALTGVLVNTEPAREVHTGPSPGPSTASVGYHTGGIGGAGTLSLRIAAAATGSTVVDIIVRDAGGHPVDLAELDAAGTLPERRLGPLPLTVRHQGRGHYQADGPLPLPGRWRLSLTVRTSEIDETTVAVPVIIQ